MSVRAPVGPVNVTPIDCCIGRGLAAIRPIEGKSTTEFLYFYLHSIEKQLVGTEGAVFASISKEDIEKIEVPIVPVDEQEQMISKIKSALFEIEKIAINGRRTLQLIEEISSSIFKQAMVGNTNDIK